MLTVPTPASTTLEMRPYVIEWDSRLFPTMGAFRAYLIGRGMDWSDFLARHPGVADRTGLPFVQWDGRRFYDQASLTRHLDTRKIGYRRWARDHPFAATILAGKPVVAANRTVAQVQQKPAVITWASFAFTAPSGLRSYVERRGANWNAFLVKHPAAAQRLALPSVTWKSKRFFTRAALAQWLAEHDGSLGRWEKAHPGLSERLMA